MARVAIGRAPVPFTELDMLEVLTVPATETPTALVVWLHGLGASGDDFVPVVPMMQMPWVHWAFPNAPVQPVTVNGGYRMPSWYDIMHMEPGPGRENLDDLRASAAAVDRVIQTSLSTHNIPASRVVIAGFSQGGAVAMELLTHGTRVFAGSAVLSSYWATDNTPPTDVNAGTPTFFGHGRADAMVPVDRGQAAHDALRDAGRTVSWQDYPMGHEVCVQELQSLAAVLRTWVPRETS